MASLGHVAHLSACLVGEGLQHARSLRNPGISHTHSFFQVAMKLLAGSFRKVKIGFLLASRTLSSFCILPTSVVKVIESRKLSRSVPAATFLEFLIYCFIKQAL